MKTIKEPFKISPAINNSKGVTTVDRAMQRFNWKKKTARRVLKQSVIKNDRTVQLR
jgi:ABC-type antimicrobial peptide transport system ATPase subunit